MSRSLCAGGVSHHRNSTADKPSGARGSGAAGWFGSSRGGAWPQRQHPWGGPEHSERMLGETRCSLDVVTGRVWRTKGAGRWLQGTPVLHSRSPFQLVPPAARGVEFRIPAPSLSPESPPVQVPTRDRNRPAPQAPSPLAPRVAACQPHLPRAVSRHCPLTSGCAEASQGRGTPRRDL